MRSPLCSYLRIGKGTTDKDCSPEQLDIIRRVRSGQNVFFSGSAGTGKSFVISQCVVSVALERNA